MSNLASQFSALLSKPASQIEKPKPMPAGTYTGIIKGHAFDVSKQKKTPFVRFTIQPVAPGEDVDPEQLEAFGGLNALSKKALTRIRGSEFYISEDAQFRLKSFLEDVVGLDLGERSMGEALPETMNKPIGFTIKHVPSEDGQEIYAEISGFTRVEG